MSDDGLDWVRKEAAKSMGSNPLSIEKDLKAQIDEEEAKGTKIFWGVIAGAAVFVLAKVSAKFLKAYVYKNGTVTGMYITSLFC